MLQLLKQKWRERALPPAATAEARRDRDEGLGPDPGPDRVITACMAWLSRAQDLSTTRDGGVARDFSLRSGWNSSYPETTGYIIPTFLRVAGLRGDEALRERGRQMLDWCLSIQYPDGPFQGGRIDSKPRVPVTFNTGQILLGLAAGALEFGEPYGDAMRRAATWLRDTLDEDGCWRRFPTPFAAPGEKAYETHVSWGLFEADRVCPAEGFGAAGLRQVDWALTKQHANGWFERCCLDEPQHPLSHTLGYVLRGVIEAYRFSRHERYLDAAVRTAEGLLSSLRDDGALPGRIDANWRPTVTWSCLTGNAQVASCLFMLERYTSNAGYGDGGRRLAAFDRRTMLLSGDPDRVGGVKGSFPIDGGYGRFQYLNWAPKFLVDACLHELGHFEEPA